MATTTTVLRKKTYAGSYATQVASVPAGVTAYEIDITTFTDFALPGCTSLSLEIDVSADNVTWRPLAAFTAPSGAQVPDSGGAAVPPVFGLNGPLPPWAAFAKAAGTVVGSCTLSATLTLS